MIWTETGYSDFHSEVLGSLLSNPNADKHTHVLHFIRVMISLPLKVDFMDFQLTSYGCSLES